MDFLLTLTKDNKQATKRNRYSVLSVFLQLQYQYGAASPDQSLQYHSHKKDIQAPTRNSMAECR